MAVSVPSSEDGSAPVTRLSTAASELGWTNRVSSPALMEKSRQLMMAVLDSWSIVTVLPPLLMIARPADTTPSEGFAHAPGGTSSVAARTRLTALEMK